MIETDALTLARQIRAKEVSPVAVVEALLRRIEALQPTVNAFITVTVDEAREAGRRAAGAAPRRAIPDEGRPLGGGAPAPRPRSAPGRRRSNEPIVVRAPAMIFFPGESSQR